MDGVTDDPGDTSGGAQEPGDYCRSVETYLCRKNDGHLIRIAGPAFTRVCGWATEGIPLNIVYRGIDRYFERYYAHGPRRRPVQIEFCANDVLDVFDEWRRAVGLWVAGDGREAAGGRGEAEGEKREAEGARRGAEGGKREAAGGRREGSEEPGAEESRPAVVSLPAHLERVIVRLTTLRAGGRMTGDADGAVAKVIRELDGMRLAARDEAGTAREACIVRLQQVDEDLLASVRDSLAGKTRNEIDREAQRELAPFKGVMAEDAYRRAVETSASRLVRERFGLPVVAYPEGR